MCATLRYTVNRGRSSPPRTRLRSRYLIRSRRSSFVLILIVVPRADMKVGVVLRADLKVGSYTVYPSGPRLANLLLEHLARIADAFLFVRIRFPQPADVRRHLAYELPVGA